ncbi:hypothetical protein [Chryseobacterium sp. RR2-3-20]|uniref:hypothetical protein n=1 Tax=Chryseobacterium sp. RR2-3-20 TaxID=2787626 RepID=UPI001AE0319F|nr:hypothetical protein [Chryseobacterium sp. RR2-3-20]
MKKLNLAILLLLTVLAVFACSRHEEEMSTESTKTSRLKRNDLNSNRIYANTTVDSISRNLFMYGVKSYSLDNNNKVIFQTYGDFKVNEHTGNISNYQFTLNGDSLRLNTSYLLFVNTDSQLKLQTPYGTSTIDNNFDFSTINLETMLLLSVYGEIFSKQNDRDTYANHSARMMAGGCPWWDTYYVSGWGYTPDAAWSDYKYSLSHGIGLPSGGHCTAIGKPHLQENEFNIGIVKYSWYQVNGAFCCP